MAPFVVTLSIISSLLGILIAPTLILSYLPTLNTANISVFSPNFIADQTASKLTIYLHKIPRHPLLQLDWLLDWSRLNMMRYVMYSIETYMYDYFAK